MDDQRNNPTFRARDAVLEQISWKFNVNNFIMSKAAPPKIPILHRIRNEMSRPGLRVVLSRSHQALIKVARFALVEFEHRVAQIYRMGLLPRFLYDRLVPDQVPSHHLVLEPEIEYQDFSRMLQHPTRGVVSYWVLWGERTTWPFLEAIRVRTLVEYEVEKVYQANRALRYADNPSKIGGVAGMRSLGMLIPSYSVANNQEIQLSGPDGPLELAPVARGKETKDIAI